MKNKDLLKALKICAFIPIIGAIIVLFAGMIIFKKRRYTLKDLLKLYLIFLVLFVHILSYNLAPLYLTY